MAATYRSLLKRAAHFQVDHPYLTVAIVAALLVIMLGGVQQVKTNAALEQMMPPQIEEIDAFHTLRDNGMGQDVIAAVITVDPEASIQDPVTDITDPRVANHIRALKAQLERNHDVLRAYAYTDFLPEGLTDAQYREALRNPALQGYLSQFVDEKRTTTVIMLTTDIAADDARMQGLATKVKQDIDAYGRPPGTTIALTGTPVIQQRLGELIAKDKRNTQLISTVFVLLVVWLIFSSFSSALVPIIIVTTSVTFLQGTMGYAGIPMSTLAAGVAAMVIGIGIDFSIHIINKFKFEREKGCDIKTAIECAVVDTGTALTFTTITTVAAFLAFLVGAMPEMNRFGLLMAMGIAYSLLFSLLALPALLVIEEKLIYLIRDKARFGLEHELHLEGGDA